MKTDDIYISMLNIVTDKKATKDSGFRLYGIPIYDYQIYSKPLKPVLVLYKTNKYGQGTIIDLNTRQKYSFEVPSTIGKIFINSETFESFNSITGNTKTNLSKRKILKMGNQIIDDVNKKMKEEE